MLQNKYLVLFLFLFFSCKKNTPVIIPNGNPTDSTANTGQYYEYSITPSVTNTAINTFNNDHYVNLDTRTTLKNKLFIFLPGTTGFPSAYKLIVKEAASLGYHAIGLMYPNSVDLYTASQNNPDNNEFGKCRQEIFDGSNQTASITITPDNSIKSRLQKLLVYLSSQYPQQNWQQFLNNGNINWSQCVVAGHSQGGGHALYISKQVLVDRAVVFSSIDWNAALAQSANWIGVAGATPNSKIYSINGINDEIFSYSNVQTQMIDLGLAGPFVSIDNTNPPYSNAHTLITTATPAFSLLFPNHNITSLDQYVPKDNSGGVNAVFKNAWDYLLTH
jgi:hypothetical protein